MARDNAEFFSGALEVHATHAAAVAVVGRWGLLLRRLGDHGFGGDQQASVGAQPW
jgi:hypothetical protein